MLLENHNNFLLNENICGFSLSLKNKVSVVKYLEIYLYNKIKLSASYSVFLYLHSLFNVFNTQLFFFFNSLKILLQGWNQNKQVAYENLSYKCKVLPSTSFEFYLLTITIDK